MFTFMVSKEILEKAKQDLLKNLLEGDLLSLVSQFPIMKKKLQELKIEFEDIEECEKTIYLMETGASKEYLIYINYMLVACFSFFKEFDFTRKLKVSYYNDMKGACNGRRNLYESKCLEFRFLKPDITVFTSRKTFVLHFEAEGKKKLVERYRGNLLITEEVYDRTGLCERYYNLNGHQREERIWFNRRIPDISRNRFDKQFKNALALTKEKQS